MTDDDENICASSASAPTTSTAPGASKQSHRLFAVLKTRGRHSSGGYLNEEFMLNQVNATV